MQLPFYYKEKLFIYNFLDLAYIKKKSNLKKKIKIINPYNFFNKNNKITFLKIDQISKKICVQGSFYIKIKLKNKNMVGPIFILKKNWFYLIIQHKNFIIFFKWYYLYKIKIINIYLYFIINNINKYLLHNFIQQIFYFYLNDLKNSLFFIYIILNKIQNHINKHENIVCEMYKFQSLQISNKKILYIYIFFFICIKIINKIINSLYIYFIQIDYLILHRKLQYKLYLSNFYKIIINKKNFIIKKQKIIIINIKLSYIKNKIIQILFFKFIFFLYEIFIYNLKKILIQYNNYKLCNLYTENKLNNEIKFRSFILQGNFLLISYKWRSSISNYIINNKIPFNLYGISDPYIYILRIQRIINKISLSSTLLLYNNTTDITLPIIRSINNGIISYDEIINNYKKLKQKINYSSRYSILNLFFFSFGTFIGTILFFLFNRI